MHFRKGPVQCSNPREWCSEFHKHLLFCGASEESAAFYTEEFAEHIDAQLADGETWRQVHAELGPPAEKAREVLETRENGIEWCPKAAEENQDLDRVWRILRSQIRGLDADQRDITSLRLGSSLPINLREFLLAEFGGGLRIEDDVIYFLRPGAGDLFVRELARAIRRFSYIRAQEHWVECAIERSQLEADLARQPAPDYAVVLCLECERFSAGTLAEHQGERCVTLVLSAAGRDSQEQPPPNSAGIMTGRGLYPVIEEFRQARQMAGLSHFGIDYYVANDHIVFTWRRLRKAEPFITENWI